MNYVGERVEAINRPKYRMVRSHGLWAKVKVKDKDTMEVESIEPRMQCVVIEPQDEQKWGSIYLATGLNESSNRRGRVVSVGPGPWKQGTDRRDPIPLKPGQQVAFMRAAGAEVECGGKMLRIMVEEDIRCIVEGME
jgi:co-chaperonin GroES (HSP10)